MDEQIRIGIENCFFHAGLIAQESFGLFGDVARKLMKPHVKMRPAISLDGNMWCALYGENIQDGVVGYGLSPEQAMAAFDRAWVAIQGAPLKEDGKP